VGGLKFRQSGDQLWGVGGPPAMVGQTGSASNRFGGGLESSRGQGATRELSHPRWYQWHRNRGRVEFLDPRLAPGLFYSPILFVDGHCRVFNFTKALCADPYYPFEETKDWAWYVPQPEAPAPAATRAEPKSL
jgi:hypothetical protein